MRTVISITLVATVVMLVLYSREFDQRKYTDYPLLYQRTEQ